jgi:hypothetical protein
MQDMLFNRGIYKVKNSFVRYKGFSILIHTDSAINKHSFFLGSWEMNRKYWIGDREIKKEEALCILRGRELNSIDRILV